METEIVGSLWGVNATKFLVNLRGTALEPTVPWPLPHHWLHRRQTEESCI